MGLCYVIMLHILSSSGLRNSWITWTCLLVFFNDFFVTGRPTRNPSLLSNPTVVSYHVGEIAILFCSVTNLGKHTVTWRKMPSPAPLTIGTDRWVNDKRLHAEHVPNSSQWNLVIENVKMRDQGQYECQVSHRKSKQRHRVTLQVKEKQELQLPRIEISGENVIRVGATLKLTCNASVVDVGVEKIVWLKDGTPIRVDRTKRFTIYTSVAMTHQNSGIISSSLHVRNVRVDDSGFYLCRSTERAQMAGVKVDVQGGNNRKRAGTEGSPHREARDYSYSRSSNGGHSNAMTLHYVNKWVVSLCIVAYSLTAYMIGQVGNLIPRRRFFVT